MGLRLLTLADVQQSISMEQAIDAMESAFKQLARQEATVPLRTAIAIEQEQAMTLTMPAYLVQEKILGLKVVSIFPNNLAHNKPSINGFIMLLDAETGEPKVLMDAGYLTAMRTGAVSGLATRYFAKEDAHHAAIIGSGQQALTQLQAVAAVRDIKQVSIWSRNKVNAEQFAKQFAHAFDISVHSSVSSAVKNADIICTATSSTEPLIHLEDIAPDIHINAIGSHTSAMREISNSVLGEAIVIADQREAVLAESGEIMSAINQHHLAKESIIELGHWLLHKKDDYKKQLTMFKSVGLAIQDLSVAEVVYQNAQAHNLGMPFALS
ncbi:ornithine cyclodeaminase family protein [Legionella nagasakiensis]|uniref:ornithine cyclodeaminase family protein n=1 Tax=Legionella nagasakiensis TaxID=535290 RepID=UPI0010548E0E|nr:ornithine cyclodeaminase family protein [Legionella nagasakiensis]